MPEMPYPGSPSLQPEARDKVAQTFRHTLDLARGGRNEEALLGCDFILKMDPRFAPARQLLEALRGVASGTVVDLAGFQESPAPASPEPARAASPSPAATIAVPSMPGSGFGEPAAATPAPGGLPDLGFDAFAAANPFAAPPAGGPAPLSNPFGAPPAPVLALDNPFAAPASPSPAAPSFDLGANPFAAPPAAPPASNPFGAPAANPFAAPSAAPSLDDLGFSEPPAFAPPAGSPPALDNPFAAPAAPAPGPAHAPAPAMAPPQSTDPRIVQFLRQGDDAMARGNIQEAIDLWSRVFLIDLSNEEASRRIDAARSGQEENARKIDVLLSEGINLYDSGDLAASRLKFLDVLTLSESDQTARNYLNQIDAALAPREGTQPAAPMPHPASSASSQAAYESAPAYEPLPADVGSFEADFGGGTPAEPMEEPEPPAPVKRGMDARVLIGAGALGLIVIAGGAYFLLGGKKAEPPKNEPANSRTRPGTEDFIAKAQALFDTGKVDEALAVLGSIPSTDPRHPEALGLIEKFKLSAAPTPSAPAFSAAQLDEMRAAGIAAAKGSRYIDAVKSLDPVVKARAEDTEAAGLLKQARDQVAAMGNAVKAYNEQDYETAVKLLWDMRKQDAKNQDVEEFLFKSYFNESIQQFQAGNAAKAAQSLGEAAQLRPQDAEAQRHLKFAKKYSKGASDLLSRIYIKHLTPRP